MKTKLGEKSQGGNKMKRKQKEKNPWIMATLVLGAIVLSLIALNYYQERRAEEQQLESAINFLKFAQDNQLGEVCFIEQGVCCNTRTGKCYEVVK